MPIYLHYQLVNYKWLPALSLLAFTARFHRSLYSLYMVPCSPSFIVSLLYRFKDASPAERSAEFQKLHVVVSENRTTNKIFINNSEFFFCVICMVYHYFSFERASKEFIIAFFWASNVALAIYFCLLTGVLSVFLNIFLFVLFSTKKIWSA